MRAQRGRYHFEVARRRAAVIALAIAVLGASWTLAQAHNWTPDDGCGPGPSADSYFWAAGPASGWVTDTGSGVNGCHLRTRNSTSTRFNWAEWYLPISNSNYNHNYSLGVSLYSYSTDLTWYAHYTVWGYGHGGGVTDNKYLNQNGSRWGYCYSVGYSTVYGTPNGGLVDIEDKTGESANSKWVAVDQFCYIG